MRNEALGIAINGHEIKIAHIIREKHHLILDYLESATLKSDLEEEAKKKQSLESTESAFMAEDDDIFAIKEEPNERRTNAEQQQNSRENTDIIYALISKFAAKKTKIAFNVPASGVSYQELDTHLDYNQNVFKGTLRKKIDEWRQGFNSLDNVSIISRRDGSLCNVICETRQPAILDILEQLNAFFRGNLQLSLMDSNEVALANLARNSYGLFHPEDITIIIEMENEFSRIIFMKGDDLLFVSPLISENYSQDFLNILYSKIIYEVDNNNISEISNIVLSGKASNSKTKAFFEQKFPDSRVGYIVSQPLAENLSSQFSREELSEYAIAIGLAWKAVQSKTENFIPTNLLSKQIVDSQNIFKLNLTSYALLAILGITAFTFTWQITAGKLRNNSLRTQNRAFEERIKHSEQTVKKVREIEDKIHQLSEGLTLSDSLSYGSDRLLNMLEQLNQTILTTRSAWIEEVHSEKNGFTIKGMSLKRKNIPDISRSLETAKINKMIRSDFGNDKLFAFELEVDLEKDKNKSYYEKVIEPHDPPGDFNNVQAKAANAEDKGAAFSMDFESDGYTQESPRVSETHSSTTITSIKRETDLNTANNELKAINADEPQGERLKIEKRNNSKESSKQVLRNNTHSQFEIRANAHAIRLTAQKEVQQYKSKGYDAYIKKVSARKNVIPYWVCLGKYSSYDEAQNKVNELKGNIPGRYRIMQSNRK